MGAIIYSSTKPYIKILLVQAVIVVVYNVM